MSTDPLPLSAMLTGPPNEADYDAMHAAITASERGRWFLSEYANRNRHADTDMLVAAIARVEAAMRGDPPPQSPSLPSPVYGGGKINEPSPVYGGGKGGGCRDLIAIAAAIDRVEALIGAGAAPGPDGSAAAERIADIAFVLHERDVEASLCDALDAAVREICEASALNEAAAQRMDEAAALLRELASRVNDMIALSVAEHRGEPPAAAAAALASIEAEPAEPAIADQAGCEEAANHDEPPRAGLFEANLQEDEDFAQAVAALAASLPSLADPAEPASDPRREPADGIAEPPDHGKQPEPPSEAADDARMAASEAELPHSECSAEVSPVIDSSGDAFLREQSLRGTLAKEELSGEDLSGDESPIREIPGERASSEALSSEDLSSTEIPSAWASSQQLPGEDSANEDGLALPEPGTIMPAAPTDDQSKPAPEAAVVAAVVAAVGDDTALASQNVPLAADANAEPGHSALTEPAEPDPQWCAEAGASAVDQTVHPDIERDHETHWSGEPERQCVADVVVGPDGDDASPLVDAGPSRALLPESQPPVGPEEDPGDLFEPVAKLPFASPVEAVAPVVAPAPPSDHASNPEHTRAPSSEREPECGHDAQAAMSAPEAEGLGEVSSVDTAALALSPSAAPDAKPPPQAPPPQPRVAAVPAAQAVPRSAPSDPLAPVRALSKEEMIALFS